MNALNSLHTYFKCLEVLLISSICFLFMCRYVLIVMVSSTNGIRSSFLNYGIQESTILLKLQSTLPEMSKIRVGSPCFKKNNHLSCTLAFQLNRSEHECS